jgi:uncharacterized membrane protein (UPF0127 family)
MMNALTFRVCQDMKKPGFGTAAVVACAMVAMLPSPCAMAVDMPVMDLSAGIHRIQAEVAATGPARGEGLMYRRQLAPNHGMLFVFSERARHCMWMRNTYIPLSVAFIDEQGKILNIEDMQPQTDDNHCAARPARFALEMGIGWFAKRGIAAGQTIDGLDRAGVVR